MARLCKLVCCVAPSRTCTETTSSSSSSHYSSLGPKESKLFLLAWLNEDWLYCLRWFVSPSRWPSPASCANWCWTLPVPGFCCFQVLRCFNFKSENFFWKTLSNSKSLSSEAHSACGHHKSGWEDQQLMPFKKQGDLLFSANSRNLGFFMFVMSFSLEIFDFKMGEVPPDFGNFHAPGCAHTLRLLGLDASTGNGVLLDSKGAVSHGKTALAQLECSKSSVALANKFLSINWLKSHWSLWLTCLHWIFGILSFAIENIDWGHVRSSHWTPVHWAHLYRPQRG